MERTRALRRHNSEKMKRRAVSFYGGYAKGDSRIVGKHATTPKVCSRYCCGNPRKWFGDRTQQEKRSALVSD